MKKTLGLYPGSFNPFHEGHLEVVKKALKVFDRVIVAKGINPEKQNEKEGFVANIPNEVEFIEFNGLLADLAKKLGATAIIKGIRNSRDLEDEMTQQYYNEEELGLDIPTLCILSSYKYIYKSSTGIRTLKKFQKG